MSLYLNRRTFLKSGLTLASVASLGIPGIAGSQSGSVRWGIIGAGSRGTHLMRVALDIPGIAVTAVCDIDESHANRAVDYVYEKTGKRPAAFTRGPEDYLRMLERPDVDAVLVATPMRLHAKMSVDALGARKHVLSEVAAAATVNECWDLVRATETTDKIYMLSENCCYYRHEMMILGMLKAGLFGELTYSECGYVHDCRFILFEKDGSLTWRGELARDLSGNWYPTHALGPVSQWMGINRGDRLKSLTSVSTREAGISDYVLRKFPENTEARRTPFTCGDSNSTLIRTAKGRVINLRFDTQSPKPHPNTIHLTLQGTRASFEDRNAVQQIWIDGRSAEFKWEPLEKYLGEFDHHLWREWGIEAQESGHGGADYFTIRDFHETIINDRPSPINVYDAAAWSSIIELSQRSVENGSRPVEIPDFTNGKWKS